MGKIVETYVRLLEASKSVETVPKRANEERIRLFRALSPEETQLIEDGKVLSSSTINEIASRSNLSAKTCRNALDSFLIWRHQLSQEV